MKPRKQHLYAIVDDAYCTWYIYTSKAKAIEKARTLAKDYLKYEFYIREYIKYSFDDFYYGIKKLKI